MRSKNAITIKGKDGKDNLAGLSTYEKWSIVRHGRKCDPEALAAVRALHHAIYQKAEPPCPDFDQQLFAHYRDQVWDYIALNYQKSWSKHDGSFFRKLADAMEVAQRPVDPVHSVIGGEILFRQQRGLPMPTIAEALKLCKEAECPPVIRKTIERIFKSYGVRPTPAKRGAKPGTKQKPVHRTSRRN